MLPEDVTEDDGQDRGIVLALINANPGRQFEFVQSQWVNDGDFVSQGRRTDPIVGRRDHSDDFAYPEKPVRRRLTGLPEFTATRGGEHVFLPGSGDCDGWPRCSPKSVIMQTHKAATRTSNA